mmetsp:Transcript_12562/g.22921  ORF Transcript_12562/g.22921 Transcript_12562/m.22921 type:complete len:275 (+) Transcript_12562:3-827(+)
MENDRERETYLLSRFEEQSVTSRKNKRRMKFMTSIVILHTPALLIITLPMILLGLTPWVMATPLWLVFTCYRNIPGRVVLDSLIMTRLLAGLFFWNCRRQMKRKFRTRSTFDIQYMQEIKYILFGNVGDFDKFNDEDRRVIREASDQFYESETLIRGLPFYPTLPRMENAHYHDGVRKHNEEIGSKGIDRFLNERWTGKEVEAVKLALWVSIEFPDAFFYIIGRILVKFLHAATRKADTWSMQVRPSFASKFSDFGIIDLKQDAAFTRQGGHNN